MQSGKKCLYQTNVPLKRDPGFIKVGSLLGGITYSHTNRFQFFNRILLQGDISLNGGRHFVGMFFLHISTP